MKNVLMLTNYFYPFNCTATQRVAKMAKYLPEYGWNPIIVCPKWTAKNCRIYDSEMVNELEKYNIASFLFTRGTRHRSMQKLISLIDAIATPQIFISKLLLRIDGTLFVRKRPVGFYYRGMPFLRTFLKSNRVDCVWATGPPPVTHTMANLIHKEFGIPWIGDFRDIPDQIYTVDHSERLRARRIKIEPVILSSSSAIVVVSEGLKEVLQKRHKKPIFVIPNGFDPEDYADRHVQNRKIFSIVYTGKIIFPCRNPTSLLEALESLIGSKKIKSSEISFSYYGAETKLMEELTGNFLNLSDVVHISDFVSFTKSIEIQKKACILLHLAHAGEKGIMTGKLYEYLGARRPILCIPGDGDGVDELLAQTKAGVVCRNVEETAAQLLRWYQEWKRTGTVSYYGRGEEIMKYSRKEQARDLAKLLDQTSDESRRVSNLR